jgi:hypothetical protein
MPSTYDARLAAVGYRHVIENLEPQVAHAIVDEEVQ